MKSTLLFATLALVGTALAPAFACEYTHTTAAQSSTVVACAGGKCEAQQPAPTPKRKTSPLSSVRFVKLCELYRAAHALHGAYRVWRI
jgi:hypothetical protein